MTYDEKTNNNGIYKVNPTIFPDKVHDLAVFAQNIPRNNDCFT